jgi:NADPH:quinone reductase-like Zn-dependent oxidoreductase
LSRPSAWLLVASLAALVACGGEGRVSGVLIGVEATTINRTDAFTLRADDGVERRFIVSAEAERAGHTPSPGHLRQHMTYGDRVTVRYREGKDGPFAIEVVDGS